jgi:hypothetical protein
MSLAQLESYRDVCEKMLNKFKVDEILESGFNLCGMGYNAVFPEGIPVGNSHLEFGDIGKEVRENFLDSRTPTGFSFARILSKYDLNITDEFMILIKTGEIFLKNIKLTAKEKKDEKSKSSKNKEAEYLVDSNDELSDLD